MSCLHLLAPSRLPCQQQEGQGQRVFLFSAPGKRSQSNPMVTHTSGVVSLPLQDKTAKQQFQDKLEAEVRKIIIMQIVS